MVAGVRAGVQFGFETSPHGTLRASPSRAAASRRIALGTYAAEELQAMINQDPFLSLNSTTVSEMGLDGPRAGQRGTVVLTEVEAQDIFARLDTNSDNKISMIEFIHGLRGNTDLARRLGLPTVMDQEDESHEIFQHAFGNMDMDLNQNISFGEFASYYAQVRSRTAPSNNVEADSQYAELESIIEESTKQVFLLQSVD